jgi:hypothetical protein
MDPPHGGLLVLGADNDHLPCEGGTVTAPPQCSGKAFGALAAVLESGMDNRLAHSPRPFRRQSLRKFA